MEILMNLKIFLSFACSQWIAARADAQLISQFQLWKNSSLNSVSCPRMWETSKLFFEKTKQS